MALVTAIRPVVYARAFSRATLFSSRSIFQWGRWRGAVHQLKWRTLSVSTSFMLTVPTLFKARGITGNICIIIYIERERELIATMNKLKSCSTDMFIYNSIIIAYDYI